ncbi:MAG: hypothetical protein ABWW70_06600 [Thermoproteota archaeon]
MHALPPIIIEYYREVELSLGKKVRLTALTLERVEERSLDEDIIDVVAELKERYKNTPNYVMIVKRSVEGKAEEFSIISTLRGSLTLLYPVPALLKEVVLLSKSSLNDAQGSISNGKRYKVRGNYYVFAGKVEVEDDVQGLMLITDRGPRIIMLNSDLEK